jgi:hypothetical protein
MPRDTQDRLLWGGLIMTLLLLGVLLAGHSWRQEATATTTDKALERQLAYQARINLLHSLYEPVLVLRRQGQDQAALLELDDLARRYPGEAHGFILKGEILRQMGVHEEAIASFVVGVRRNGDYIDADNPLSRREIIRQVVEESLPTIRERARANPQNASLSATLNNLFYLQSRLAGGCE